MSPPAAARAKSHEDFSRSLRLSAGAHAALIILAILGALVFHRDPVVLSPSIRVDLVGLPDIRKKDLSPPAPDLSEIEKKLDASPPRPPAARPKEAEREKPELSLKNKKNKRENALESAIDRIKALDRIESQMKNRPKASQKVRGNAVSKGNALTGSGAQDINAYAAAMQSKLRENWNLPVWLAKQNLSARVVVFLDDKGYVANAVLAQGSGNKQYDEYVLKTVRLSQPFGPPPSDILDDGVLLLFPL